MLSETAPSGANGEACARAGQAGTAAAGTAAVPSGVESHTQSTPPPAESPPARSRRPLTHIPASLLDDLKREAWDTSNEKLACILLMFDPATDGERTPLHLAGSLVEIAQLLAKADRGHRKFAAERIDATLMHSADALPPTGCASDVQHVVGWLRANERLQRRVWRVIEGLMVAVRGGVQ